MNSIQGATALKLNNEVEAVNQKADTLVTNEAEEIVDKKEADLVSTLSLENAAYFENNFKQDHSNNNIEELEETVIDEISLYDEKSKDNLDNSSLDEVSPQLFSDEGVSNTSSEGNNDEILKSDEEEDFEIPAFLRKQKF